MKTVRVWVAVVVGSDGSIGFHGHGGGGTPESNKRLDDLSIDIAANPVRTIHRNAFILTAELDVPDGGHICNVAAHIETPRP